MKGKFLSVLAELSEPRDSVDLTLDLNDAGCLCVHGNSSSAPASQGLSAPCSLALTSGAKPLRERKPSWLTQAQTRREELWLCLADPTLYVDLITN